MASTGGLRYTNKKDEDENSPVQRMLRAQESQGSSTPVAPSEESSGDQASNVSSTGGLYNAKDESPSGIKSQEESAGNGGWYAPDNSSSTARGRARFRITRRQAAGGAVAGGAIVSIFIGFLSLAPLRVETVVRLLNKYMTPSENAMQQQADNMMERYFVKHVLPDYKRCGTTLSRACSVNLTSSSNPVAAVYKDWADNRLEYKLATKYNIEFKYDRAANRWYLRAPGTDTNTGDNLGPNGERLSTEFRRSDRATMRAAFNQALDGETTWKKVRTRFQVGRLLEEKYGIKRCIAFCGVKDTFADHKDQKKNAAKIFLAQRVIQPRNEALGIVMECLFGSSCDAQSTQTTTPEAGTSGELEGTPENPQIDSQIRTQLTALAASYGVVDKDAVDKMIKNYEDISEKGYQKYALSRVLEKLGLSQFTDQVADAVPIVGWVDRASALISNASTLGPNIRKLTFVTNRVSAVAMFTMLSTYMDEIHTGHVDATEVGSMNASLNAGQKVGDKEPVGGYASAEDSPVYRALSGNDQSTTTTSFNPFAIGTASAASAKTACEDGNPVPAGQLACKEEILGQGSGAADGISSFLNLPGINFISKAAGIVHAPFAAFSNFLGGLFGLVPGVDSVSKVASEQIEPVYDKAVNEVVPNPLGNGNLSGSRNVQIAAAGASVVAKDAGDQIGAQNVDAGTYTSIINQQSREDWQVFSHKSFFARAFDRSSNYSLVSRVAMSTRGGIQNSFGTTILSGLRNSFGSIFGSLTFGSRASAASNIPAAAADPFKVGMSAYPDGTIPEDPEQYWDQHNCGDTSENGPIARWQKEASDGPKDPNTGMPVHTRTEPCLLIKYTVGAVGGKYNTDNLTPDEQQILNGGGNPTGGSETSSGSLPTGSSQDLAKQLLPYISQGKIFCGSAAGGSGSADCSDIQNTAKGTPLGGNCQVDELTPHLLGLLLGLVRDNGWSLGLSATCSDHHLEGDGPYAGHSYGSTVDFGVEEKDGSRSANLAAATNEKFINDVAALLSTTGGSFGQVGECHPIYSSQKSKKFVTFNDTCNHQHVRAAP